MPAAVLLRAGLSLREERAHRRPEHVHRVVPVGGIARLVAWTSIHRHAQSATETEERKVGKNDDGQKLVDDIVVATHC